MSWYCLTQRGAICVDYRVYTNVVILDIDLIHSTKCHKKLKVSCVGDVLHVTSNSVYFHREYAVWGRRHFCHLDKVQIKLKRVHSEAPSWTMLGSFADIVI